MFVNQELNDDIVSIVSNTDYNNMPSFMKFFWEEQQKYLQSKKNGIRYHPAILRFCLSLAAKSPSASYDDLALFFNWSSSGTKIKIENFFLK